MVWVYNEAQKRPTGQSVAYSPSQMPHFCPKKKRGYRRNYGNPLIWWWALSDLNRGPTDYESAALTN